MLFAIIHDSVGYPQLMTSEPVSTSAYLEEVPLTGEQIADQFEECWNSINFDHVEAVTIETPTTVRFEVYLIEDARIPPLTMEPVQGTEGTEDVLSEVKALEVTTMAGDIMKIQVCPPYTVQAVKEEVQKFLGMPALVQRIIVAGEELKELEDSEEIPEDVNSVTLLRRDPPRITTLEFLETMAFCVHDWKQTVIQHWCNFDTCYRKMPVDKRDRFQWFSKFKDMQHTAFTTDDFLESLNTWFYESRNPPSEEDVDHPEDFQRGVAKLQSFLEEHCHSPSLFQVYADCFCHNDDQEFVMLMAGRLKVAPQSLLVGAVNLNCWIWWSDGW